MISSEDLQDLVRQGDRINGSILSVYLDVDQSNPSNLNREFEATLKTLLRGLQNNSSGKPENNDFASNAEQVLRFVSGYRPGAKGLVLFSAAPDGFFWRREVNVPLGNEAHYGRLYIRPLVDIVDEYEKYGVAVADRDHARLFTVRAGEIRERESVEADADVRHYKNVGTDRWWSHAKVQRKADEHARWHIKHVAEALAELDHKERLDRLIIAGPVEARNDLQHALPKRLARKVAASVLLPVDAPKERVREAVSEIERRVEREEEIRVLDEALTAAAKKQRAVTGLSGVLAALQEGRIHRLLVSESFSAEGGECEGCGVLTTASSGGDCPSCGGGIKAIGDLVNPMMARVTALDGRTDVVHGEADDRLAGEGGGVAALLRF